MPGAHEPCDEVRLEDGEFGGFRTVPKKHISKNEDRDIPYKPPYNEAQKAGISP